MNKVTDQVIKKALKQKHYSDVFFTEVKNGPTWTARHFRLDAWAMKKSWRNSNMLGYEIKVSRSDFLADKKWKNYLPLCNTFYFVCPKGLIKKDEIPDDVGLIYYNPEKDSLKTVKAPAYRKIEPPTDLFIYLLMCRIDRDYENKIEKVLHFREFIRNDLRSRYIGQQLRKKTAQTLKKKDKLISDLRIENNNLKYRLRELEEWREKEIANAIQ